MLAAIIAAALAFTVITNTIPSVKIYFFKDGKLAYVKRPIEKNAEPLSVAFTGLLKGPTQKEIRSGYFSEIPKNTKITEIIKNGTLIELTFSKELANYGGGSARVLGLVTQIVYTFTEIKGINKVKINIEDKDEVVLGGEGLVIDKPLGREDFKN